mmetsp:Transcript_7554/g.11956  ORF Transcript_7554/g.11956 Transcript_7554/m.11956 type:complete len:235 (-) Transcript_7554:665-1369(-)
MLLVPVNAENRCFLRRNVLVPVENPERQAFRACDCFLAHTAPNAPFLPFQLGFSFVLRSTLPLGLCFPSPVSSECLLPSLIVPHSFLCIDSILLATAFLCTRCPGFALGLVSKSLKYHRFSSPRQAQHLEELLEGQIRFHSHCWMVSHPPCGNSGEPFELLFRILVLMGFASSKPHSRPQCQAACCANPGGCIPSRQHPKRPAKCRRGMVVGNYRQLLHLWPRIERLLHRPSAL